MPVAPAKKTAPRKAAPKKPAPVTQLIDEFEYVRETTGTFRLDEAAEKENWIIGGLYLQKGPLKGTRPKRVRVTVDVLEFQAD